MLGVKPYAILGILSLICPHAVGQQEGHPQLKLTILLEKEQFSVNENVLVRAELRNLTSQTLCFPPPDQECSTPQTGWVVVTGSALSTGDGEQFICHVDGSGAVGAELESSIRNRWIKLPPNGVYASEPTEAKVKLRAAGQWQFVATYHPPEGSFSDAYKQVLKAASQKAGCVLPDSAVAAEPRTITVSDVHGK